MVGRGRIDLWGIIGKSGIGSEYDPNTLWDFFKELIIMNIILHVFEWMNNEWITKEEQ